MLKLYGAGRGKRPPPVSTAAQQSSSSSCSSSSSDITNKECPPASDPSRVPGEERATDGSSSSSCGAKHLSNEADNSSACSSRQREDEGGRERRRFPGEIRLQKELEDLDLPDQCQLTFSSKSSHSFQEGRNPPPQPGAKGQQEMGGVGSSSLSESSSKKNSNVTSTSTGLSSSSSSSSSLLEMNLEIKPDDGYWRGGKFVFYLTVPFSYPHDPPKVKCADQEPNPNDPLNQEAAQLLRTDPGEFQRQVFRSLFPSSSSYHYGTQASTRRKVFQTTGKKVYS
ncbi:nedd8-conjugating enzyme ubc12 [Cystoisospora suis]|uniref:Nedd8-conjugating enzyme ubc12 n=1 Tax=Cystoisospora suis TaxID=483139 RepID=A0A2C6KBH1_9APIC|nr:nedd8-conjugating enzyme ubc12 [Cystoisospora suis]